MYYVLGQRAFHELDSQTKIPMERYTKLYKLIVGKFVPTI